METALEHMNVTFYRLQLFSLLKTQMYEIISVAPSTTCGPGSVVGMATGYELDRPGIESRWGRDFPHLSRPALGPTHPPV